MDSTNPPDGRTPTRVNSPSDVAFASRDSAASGLSYQATVLNSSFTALNSVVNGIHSVPNQTTGGEGAVIGQEVQFTIHFNTPFDLPADHYFLVPKVTLSSGNFLWLSAPKPTSPPFAPDLQSWIRNSNLDPDWLRIGTDIVGPSGANGIAPTFNAAFSLSGTVIPEPTTMIAGALLLLPFGFSALRSVRRKPTA